MATQTLPQVDFTPEIVEAAAENWSRRREQREENKIMVATGRLDEVESPERIEAHERYQTEAKERKVQQEAIKGAVEFAVIPALADFAQERVIGERDFLGIEFLEMAIAVSRFVGRVHIRERPGPGVGFGTGFMVSPRLLLTNNHVLPTADLARNSEIEFDYQRDRFGRALPTVFFALEPDTFYLTDRDLDFTLVAVREKSTNAAPLRDYAWTRLQGDSGKALLGDPLNIIQHPRGEMKQLVLRSNKLVDLFDNFIHYESDTERGSSGAPVFSDYWDVVALHHSGVPKTNDRGQFLTVDGRVWVKDRDDPERLAWIGNEGIRVSSLIKFIEKAKLDSAAKKDLRKQLLEMEPPNPLEVKEQSKAKREQGRGRVKPDIQPPSHAEIIPPPETGQPGVSRDVPAATITTAGVTLVVPLQISISLGTPVIAAAPGTPVPTTYASAHGQAIASRDGFIDFTENLPPEQDYSTRRGYDASFLEGVAVPLPRISGAAKKDVAVPVRSEGTTGNVLNYHHFSVLLNKARQIAFFAAVNIDGTLHRNLTRNEDGKSEKWYDDPRLPEGVCVSPRVYDHRDLDRGHLVRRLDPVWGDKAMRRAANDDTFHWANCSPQHKNLNRGKAQWLGLEDYVLNNAKNKGLRISVFSGPVFRKNDPTYEGVQLPLEFWKVVVMVRKDGTPSATAYLLSQKKLIDELEVTEADFAFGQYKTFQVPVRRIEELTKLNFGKLRNFDPLESPEAEESFALGDAGEKEISTLEQIVL